MNVITPTHFDQAKSWSILSPMPVFVTEKATFWRGKFLSDTAAFNIAASIFLKCSPTPQMIKRVGMQTFNEYKKGLDIGYEFGFLLEEKYTDTSFRYVKGVIETFVHDSADSFIDWTAQPLQVYNFFTKKTGIVSKISNI